LLDQYDVQGRPLVANIDYKEPGQNGLHHLTLFDPDDPSSKSENNSINATLVREGLATVDTKSKIIGAYPQVAASLKQASAEAHRQRKGAYEFGDISDDPAR
jgi:staphylococcal nuclease domain-containing protein 1